MTRHLIQPVLFRATLIAIIWWSISDAVNASWLIGLPASFIALYISFLLLPPNSFNGIALLKFIPFFIKHSLSGGIDVARRAFRPSLPLNPDLITFETTLSSGLPRFFMLCVINLLPGTLTTIYEANHLQIHILDKQSNFMQELNTIESHVAAIFSISLDTAIDA